MKFRLYYFPFLLVVLLFLIDYLIYGPGISGDTNAYLRLSSLWKDGIIPHSKSYLTGFSFLVAQLSMIGNMPLYKSLSLLQGFLFMVNSFLIFWLTNKTTKHHNIPPWIVAMGCLLLAGSWSFRIQKAAHADSLFYTCFIAYLCTLHSILNSKKNVNYILLALILLISVTVKYNSYLLLPFTFFVLILCLEGEKIKRLIRTFLILSPATLQIILWKTFNGKFIDKLNSSHYENKAFSAGDFFHSLFINLANSGQTFIECLINPQISRQTPQLLSFTFFIFIIGTCLFAILKTKNIFTKVVAAYVIIYVSVFILFSSINNFTETNTRTLITVLFAFFLLIFLSAVEFLTVRKYLILPLSLLVFVNAILCSYKWLTVTSTKNNFRIISNAIRQNPDDYKLPDLINNATVFSNNPNIIAFENDYSIIALPLTSTRNWKLGKWYNLSPQERKDYISGLIDSIRSGSYMLINFPNDEETFIINEVAKQIKYVKQGRNSYFFSNK